MFYLSMWGNSTLFGVLLVHFLYSNSKEGLRNPFVQPFSVANGSNWFVVVVNTAWEAQLLLMKSQIKARSVAEAPWYPASQSSLVSGSFTSAFFLSVPPSFERSVAATGSDHHVAVLLEDDIGAVVKVEHWDAVELGRGTAGLGHRVRVDKVHL